MKKVCRSTCRRRRVFAKLGIGSFRETTLQVKPRWLLVTFAAIICWFMLAVRNGAEQVDSGWAVSVPSPLASGSTPANPEQQLLLRHVLEQTQQPLLRKPAPSQAMQPAPERTPAGVRFAVRPEADGWRPVGQPLGASGNDWTLHLATPKTESARTTPKTDDGAECDCSGMAGAVQNSSAESIPGPSRLPTLPSSNAPQPALPATVVENPGDINTEETSKDSTLEPTLAGTNATTTADSVESQSNAGQANAPTGTESKEQSQAAPSGTAAKAPAADIGPIDEIPPLTKQLLSLRTRVRAVLKGYYRKALSSRENDPWEAMHGMLAYGVHSRIHDGGPNGELITSVGWLCYNKPCKGQTLLYVTPSGELRAKYGVGLQGHLGQFLAMLAQCHVSPEYPIHVGGHEFTIHDLIEAEKKTCYPKSELTFKLIALQHYADLNDKWANDQGVDWDFPRLVREELAQPIRGAACGGTHRLSGLSLVVNTRLRRGEPLDGEYQRAADFVKKYQMYAFRLQNRDGSLSTSWFRGSGDDDDINRRIKTTGHILEWLCYSLSDEQLREPQTIRAVTYLANLMYSNYDNEWEIGPRSHATHALLLYDERVFQPFDKEGEVAAYRPAPSSVAKRNANGTLRR